MSFRDNLKAELMFSGTLVKELSERSGISKKSLDKYLTENGSIPSAEAAVKIARALGVSVEYLVTGAEGALPGAESQKIRLLASLDAKTCEIARVIQNLENHDRDVILELARVFKKKASL